MDFLSALAYYGRERPETDVIVMNSVGMYERTRKALDAMREAHGELRVFSYLDRDEAGDRVRDLLAAERGGEFSHHDKDLCTTPHFIVQTQRGG